MHIRDQFGEIYEDQSFASLFSMRGQPAEAPWRLAMVCIFQFIEGLTDRQAAEAVQQRIDWKYALALELSDPDFDFSVLSKFRARLIAGGSEMQLFEVMLEHLKTHGLRHPHEVVNEPIPRISWQQFALSTDWSG